MKKQLAIVGIIVFIITAAWLSGCAQNGEGRRTISSLSLSADGMKLLSVTNVQPSHIEKNKTLGHGPDLQIWNTSSGGILWGEYPSYVAKNIVTGLDAFFSPDGKYFVKDFRETPVNIYNVSSGELAANISGYYIDWFPNNRIITMGDQEFIIWNATTFKEIRTFSLGKMPYSYYPASLSPDGNKLAFYSSDLNSVVTVDISDENSQFLWKTNLSEEGRISTPNDFEWSINNTTIGFFCYQYSNKTNYLFILDATNGTILNKKEADGFLSPDCKKYASYDKNKDFLEIFNLDGLEKTIKMNLQNVNGIRVAAWSYDMNTIAVSIQDGIIQIINVSSGEVTKTLETRVYNLHYSIPSPSIAYILVVIVTSVLFWKRKKIISS